MPAWLALVLVFALPPALKAKPLLNFAMVIPFGFHSPIARAIASSWCNSSSLHASTSTTSWPSRSQRAVGAIVSSSTALLDAQLVDGDQVLAGPDSSHSNTLMQCPLWSGLRRSRRGWSAFSRGDRRRRGSTVARSSPSARIWTRRQNHFPVRALAPSKYLQTNPPADQVGRLPGQARIFFTRLLTLGSDVVWINHVCRSLGSTARMSNPPEKTSFLNFTPSAVVNQH